MYMSNSLFRLILNHLPTSNITDTCFSYSTANEYDVNMVRMFNPIDYNIDIDCKIDKQ